MDNKAYAIQISERINIKSCKIFFSGKLMFFDTDELFFQKSKEQYVYIFKYGIVCFYNIIEDEKKKIIQELIPFCKNPLNELIYEEIKVISNTDITKVSLETIQLSNFNIESLRVVMLNVSQSVALDKYSKIIEEILEDTNAHTTFLEEKGKLDIGGYKLRRYIGKILNIKNRISENLYIFDSHDAIWGNETLNQLDQDLKKTYDLKDRYRSIHDQIEIVKENLELFKDIMHHRQSSTLEWIIIILILVEVIDMFILKIT